MNYDKNYLYETYNATSTGDEHGELETYENWLERQLISRLETIDEMEKYDKLQVLMVDISTWSDATFGELQRNPAILFHLKKEVPELIEAIKTYQENNSLKKLSYVEITNLQQAVIEEYADCFMLLLDSVHHYGLNAEILLAATRGKLEVNKQRKWGKPDENGVVEHVRCNANKDKEQCPECLEVVTSHELQTFGGICEQCSEGLMED